MQHLAGEGRLWVIAAGNDRRGSACPPDLAAPGLQAEDDVVNTGGSTIVGPHAEETIRYPEDDPGVTLHRIGMLDVARAVSSVPAPPSRIAVAVLRGTRGPEMDV